MVITAELGRVFEAGPVFRAEDSYTHRHLCEFVGLDAEMEIKEHYFEVMDVVDHLFVEMFDALNAKCKQELEAIDKQYPFTPLKYLRKTLRLTFEEGIKMLKDAGVEADPLGDLNTESERALGKLVLEKYDTDIFILHRYPLAARPFYTMPCADNGDYSCSFYLLKYMIYCVNRAESVLPITLEDAARSEIEIANALEAGVQIVRVNQDTRLDQRVINLRTLANNGIFSLKSRISNLFGQILLDLDFVQIHTPKILPRASEGGAAVFKLDYKGKPACLAQSPQFYNQMVITAELGRVFEAGPVFRAEDSYTHRHLCEFVGLDAEMEIKEHYFEVMDVVDHLFVEMFDALNAKCKQELEAIDKQYPFTPLKYLRKTLRLTFEEGIKMLKDAGVEADPLGDLNTESERALGKLVLEKYDTDFFILHRYPLAARPFYTMPCADNGDYSCSFDVFLTGKHC
ncbi:aspartate--tRNA ligase 2, cytoplasmic-like [Bidens hawaiensis]|uniref:aspartate--tRNA ligase 2, cytoplasmic-like n=1 Tax=Bidens hawaiensis TaxID=980011 RepID=UPI004049F8B9